MQARKKEMVEIKGGEFWNPENENDSIKGTLTQVRKIRNQNGELVDRYVIQNDDGQFILPSHSDLTTKMEQIAIGSTIEATLTTKEHRKGNRMFFVYKVLADNPAF